MTITLVKVGRHVSESHKTTYSDCLNMNLWLNNARLVMGIADFKEIPAQNSWQKASVCSDSLKLLKLKMNDSWDTSLMTFIIPILPNCRYNSYFAGRGSPSSHIHHEKVAKCDYYQICDNGTQNACLDEVYSFDVCPPGCILQRDCSHIGKTTHLENRSQGLQTV